MRVILILLIFLLSGCSLTVKHIIEQEEPLQIEPINVTGNVPIAVTINIEYDEEML